MAWLRRLQETAARESSNAGCVGELSSNVQRGLAALEASVEAAVLSQQQRHDHMCTLLGELQQHKDAATAELQVAMDFVYRMAISATLRLTLILF